MHGYYTVFDHLEWSVFQEDSFHIIPSNKHTTTTKVFHNCPKQLEVDGVFFAGMVYIQIEPGDRPVCDTCFMSPGDDILAVYHLLKGD